MPFCILISVSGAPFARAIIFHLCFEEICLICLKMYFFYTTTHLNVIELLRGSDLIKTRWRSFNDLIWSLISLAQQNKRTSKKLLLPSFFFHLYNSERERTRARFVIEPRVLNLKEHVYRGQDPASWHANYNPAILGRTSRSRSTDNSWHGPPLWMQRSEDKAVSGVDVFDLVWPCLILVFTIPHAWAEREPD